MRDPWDLWASRGVGARLTRAALLPLSGGFRIAASIRNAMYDAGVFSAESLGLPTLSVGNLTVGGTGKTPVAAWLAQRLRDRGRAPAILLRGYGGDEVRVHELLSPGIPVVANPDRVAGASNARAAGADTLVLDDAFQHRRVARDADIVLVSADAGFLSGWPLPAGPWREPLKALRRASFVAVTRKVADDSEVARALEVVGRVAGSVPAGVVRFEPGELVAWADGSRRDIGALAGKRALGVSAIGNPAAFEGQLVAAGVGVEAVRFGDHHPYSAADVGALVGKSAGSIAVVCTLKDAVKLGPQWPPGGPPLWYLSQRVTVEQGLDALDRVIEAALGRR